MKRRKKNRIIFVIIVIFLVLLGIICFFNTNVNNKKVNDKENLILDISSHYNKYVKTNKETLLYDLQYNVVGKIGENVELTLDDEDNFDNKYFKIISLDNEYFVEYDAVDKIDNLVNFDDRYKKYIVFNSNIVTKDITPFYDENGNLVYQINHSFDFPIIILDNDRYGVEYANQLLYVHKEDVKYEKENFNTDESNSDGIPVLNYHFVYEDGDTSCNEEICHSSTQINTHFSYIKDNDFFTPTMKELEMYIDGKLQLPQKSVVITFDDGTMAENAKKYVDMYEINATLFIVTSWFSKDQFVSDYLEIHSHSDNLHDGGKCPGGQGAGLKCLDKELLLADLRLSREKLDNSTVFCYPFYEYNDYSIEVLKEAGFTMAFAGEYAGGKTKVVPGIDKFRLPRWVIVSYTTNELFISYVNGGS